MLDNFLKNADNQKITTLNEEKQMIPEELKYTTEHEWISVEDNIATVGITQHAVDELGEIVFVELPALNTEVSASDELGTIESVKTVSSFYAPLSGKVVEINTDLTDEPGNLNEEPYGDGWLVKLAISDIKELDDLLDNTGYEEHLSE